MTKTKSALLVAVIGLVAGYLVVSYVNTKIDQVNAQSAAEVERIVTAPIPGFIQLVKPADEVVLTLCPPFGECQTFAPAKIYAYSFGVLAYRYNGINQVTRFEFHIAY